MNLRPLTPWLIFLLTAIIYLAFPTRVYYWDGIVFARAIEDTQTLNPSLVHPNHLIYNFAGFIFDKFLHALGFEFRALTALQILNSLVSAACACVLFAILIDTLRSLYLSVCLALLFAFSATWWKFSTDANAYIPSVLFLLISFYLVLPDRKARPLLVGLMFFISMAFHQLAVFMFPVLALGVYLQDGLLSIKRRALNAVFFVVVAAVLIVTAYSYLFYLASGSFEVGRLIRWTASYSPDADTSFNLWSNLQYSLRGQVRLFFGGRVNLLKGLVNPFVVVLFIALTGAVAFLIFEAVRNSATIIRLRWLRELHLAPHQKSVLLLSLLWAAVYLVFLFVWLPQNTFYRLFYLPAFILLLGLGISSLPRNRTSQPRRITAVFVIAVALANFLFLIYPFSHVEKYPPLAFALQLSREWPAGTVIYYGAPNSDQALVQYFNPATEWKRLQLESKAIPEDEIADVYRKGGTVWLETTAIDLFSDSTNDALWLKMHTRENAWRTLDDGAFKIRFVQVAPRDQ